MKMKFVIGINSQNKEKQIEVESFERYSESKAAIKFLWVVDWISYKLIKEVKRCLYINQKREALGLDSVTLCVHYQEQLINVNDWDDVTQLDNIILYERLRKDALNLRLDTKAFIKENGLSAEDIAYTDTPEFYRKLKAYDISISQTQVELLKANVTFIRNWDYRMARDAGFENENDLGLCFNKERTKTKYVTTLLDKCKALVTLRYYEQYLEAPLKVITDGHVYSVQSTLDEIPEGWRNTPLSAGDYKDDVVLPKSAAPGRSYKHAGDPEFNWYDGYTVE